MPICDIHSSVPRGASWGDDDYIVFNAFGEPWTQLLRVAAAGGRPEPLSTLSEGEVAHLLQQGIRMILSHADILWRRACGTATMPFLARILT